MENKYQEALDNLISKTGILNDTCFHLSKCLKCGKCILEDEHFKLPVMECKDYVIAKTLQELIDKETPMKPIKEIIHDEYDYDDRGCDFEYERLICPNCSEDLVNEVEDRNYEGWNYCPNCGKRLDWSDE